MDQVLGTRKRIGLVAHDNKKPDLMEWAWAATTCARPPTTRRMSTGCSSRAERSGGPVGGPVDAPPTRAGRRR